MEDWKETLPEDLRSEPSLSAIQDIPSLAKSYVHAQKMVGADKIVLPGENASEDELTEFYTKLGRPETADKYELTRPENIPEGFPLGESLEKGFRESAHKLGLSSKQTKGLYNWFINSEVETYNNMKRESDEAVAAAEKQLRTDWGAAFDKNVNQVERLVNTFGTDELKTVLKDSGLNNNTHIIRFLGKVTEQLSEDTLKGEPPAGFDTMTPAAAQTKIKELKLDEKFMDAYMNPKNLGHKEALEKMEGLYKLAYPEPEK